MKTMPSTKHIIKQIENHKLGIAKHRDALRNLLEDARDVLDSTDDALEDIEIVIDKLSQYV